MPMSQTLRMFSSANNLPTTNSLNFAKDKISLSPPYTIIFGLNTKIKLIPPPLISIIIRFYPKRK